MKIRIKFEKQGVMRFVGHLDIMRYFQKAMRRAGIEVVYSEGFSPHQKMSFAAPLGVGLTSRGEYFDLEVHRIGPSEEMRQKMNAAMAEGMQVRSVRLLPENSKNAMSLVVAADYQVSFRERMEPVSDPWEKFSEFLHQEKIEIRKKTKKSEMVMDIRPFIYEAKTSENGIFLKLATGSENNLKPDLVIDAFCEYYALERKPFDLLVERLELYGKDENGEMIALEAFGEEITEWVN